MEYCTTCMATDNLFNIFEHHVYEGDLENYADMFMDCFNIQFSKGDGIDGLCNFCIVKLRNACHFKRQTMNTRSILKSTKDIKLEGLGNLKEEFEYIDDSLWDTIDIDDTSDLETTSNNKQKDQNKEQSSDVHKGTLLYNLLTSKKGKAGDTNPLSDTPKKNKKTSVRKPATAAHGATGTLDGSLSKKNKRVYKPEKKPFKLQRNQKQCHYCDEEFLHHKLLVEHMNVHFPNHICETCGKKFATRIILKRHLRCHNTGPFPCKQCPMVYHNLNTFMSHMRYKHSNENPYKCMECGERFRTYHQRMLHLQDVHGLTENKYKCPYCPRRFYYSGQRSKHVRDKHLRLRPYKCPECPKQCLKRPELVSHLNHVHKIGEKKFQCHVCFKRYSRKTVLTSHLRIHDEDRRFKCLVCSLGFAQKCSLKNHVQTHHTKYGQTVKIEGDNAILVED